MTAASNTGIPDIARTIISVTVIAIYIRYRILAVDFTFGKSFPTEGPGLSALIRYMFSPLAPGRSARTNTRIPMPPTQCVKLLQKRTPLGNDSTSVSMLAPVVVNPEIVSNSASVNPICPTACQSGMAPNTDMSIHERATAVIPSRV